MGKNKGHVRLRTEQGGGCGTLSATTEACSDLPNKCSWLLRAHVLSQPLIVGGVEPSVSMSLTLNVAGGSFKNMRHRPQTQPLYHETTG